MKKLFRQNKERLRNIPNILDDVLDTSQIISQMKWSEIEAADTFFENQGYSFSSTGQTVGFTPRKGRFFRRHLLRFLLFQ